MNPRGLCCRQCRAHSCDGVDWLTLTGVAGVYGRPVPLCSMHCVAQYARSRTDPAAVSARRVGQPMNHVEVR